MSEPRLLAEAEVPDDNVTTMPGRAMPVRPPISLAEADKIARVLASIARVLSVRAMSFCLVLAMIGLSYMAVDDPTAHRLIGAGGFDLLSLAGIWILGKSIPQA